MRAAVKLAVNGSRVISLLRHISLLCRGEYDAISAHSVGNCQAALGDYQGARNSYNLAVRLFEASQGGGKRPSPKLMPRLNGRVYARPNAAMMLVELGDLPTATEELEKVHRS